MPLLSAFSLLVLRRALLGFTLAAWAGLLWMVLTTGTIATTTGAGARSALLIVAVALTFAYQRVRTPPLTGTDFVEPLRRLLFGAGMLPLVGFALLGGYYFATRHLTDGPHATTANALHVAGLALYTWLLAAAAYTWRVMLLFRAPESLRRDWRAFELVQVALLLLLIVVPPLHTYRPLGFGLLTLLIVFAVYLNVNQRWVAYLSRAQKLRAALLQVALLVSLGLFAGYFELLAAMTPAPLVLAGPYVTGTLAVGALYLLANGLLLLFNLPATTVFEQGRDELLVFQRQSQRIQEGQTAGQVVEQLVANARLATEADAGWFWTAGTPLTERQHGFGIERDGKGATLTELAPTLAGLVSAQAVYVNNHLDGVGDGVLELRGLAAAGWRSVLLVPVPTTHDPAGAPSYLVLLREPAHGFDRGAIGLVQMYAHQSLLTLQNLRLMNDAVASERYKRELNIASEVQRSLIPRQLPADRVLDISVWAEAALEVGGDFYDFRQLSDTRLAIIAGDVSGKGITAAFHVAQMKGIFHSLMQLDHVPEPDKFMVKANAALAYCLERSSFITASLYVIDYDQRGFAFARAGHCHTLYYNSATEEVFYFQTPGLGPGILRGADAAYAKRVRNMYYDFNPGDVMVIYTDGITEAR
ncbi:MAG: SpoIIE family protein phosphatase, partial [Hymenobacteraceae bacterium]|nr:SpoIIE family protein phosphatase [Hymenobacteraceae bacterium]